MFVLVAQLVFHFTSPPSPALWDTLARNLAATQVEGHSLRAIRTDVTKPPWPGNPVQVQVHGKCEAPSQTLPWRPDPLGWVEVVDNKWLSIIHLDCARLAETVARACSIETDPVLADKSLAYAMAVVVRHELRHLLLQTRTHASSGEFSAALSIRDLLPPASAHDSCAWRKR